MNRTLFEWNETNDRPDRIRTVEGRRLPSSGGAPVKEDVELAVELPVMLGVGEGRFHQFACTPAGLEALGVGYAVTSGIVTSIDEISDISVTPGDPSEITLQIEARDATGCSDPGEPSTYEELSVSGDVIRRVTQELASRQTIFPRTGGTHAGGIFAASGELLYFAEDVSRSNALDKVIGRALLEEGSCDGYGVALSSRVSAQLVEKCASVDLQIIAAVSAPTTRAVGVADGQDITLCAFVREGRATVFTHPGRIHETCGRSDSQDGP